METSPDPTLRLAIAAWRASLPAMSADDIAELESHLLDSAAELQKTGLSESEAFLIAKRRLGSPAEFVEEFHLECDPLRPAAAAKAIVANVKKATRDRGNLLIAVGVTAVLVAIGIPIWLNQRPYSASVLIEIMRSGTLLEFGSFKSSPVPNESPMVSAKEFFASQVEIATAPETLRQVCNKLGLDKRWKLQNRDEAVQRLRKMVTGNGETGSDLICLTVRSQDPKEAADLAEEWANAYIERRKRLERERIDLVLVTLTQARKGQEMIVEKSRAKMIEMVQALGIVDLGLRNDRGMEGDGIKDNIYQSAMQLELQTKKEISDFKSQLESMEDKKDEELIGAASNHGIVDPKTAAIYSAYLADQTKLKQMEELGVGPNHPDMVALKTGIESQQNQLARDAKNIRNALKTKLLNAQSVLANVEKITEESKQDSIDARSNYAKYHQAKDDYLLQQDILQSMVAEQERARLNNLMPRQPAIFHGHASRPPDHGFLDSPVWWGIAAGTGGLGTALLLLGLRRRKGAKTPLGECAARSALA
jgi:capsular polysaccharide biosynthesis protein